MSDTEGTGQVLTNWAGSYRYRAAAVRRPSSLPELQELVARSRRVRPLGSRHSFTGIADTDGDLLRLDGLPLEVGVDAGARAVSVSGGARYGDVVDALDGAGWALANLASLPHISVAGAVATGTHGSGNGNRSLAAAVRELDLVGPDGTLHRLRRGEPDFDGCVVSLGALGVVVRLVLDVEPAYQVRQSVLTGLGWDALEEHFDAITAGAYSVSLFTHWTDTAIEQVWLKSRTDDATPERRELFGAVPASTTMHMLRGGDTDAVTRQGGVPGPWHGRLPHFRLEHTPSRGAELQSEYLLPRSRAAEAFSGMRRLAGRMAPVLQVCEIRTVAAEPLWLSGSYERDVVGLHFTWDRRPEEVDALLPHLEEVLLPLQARPHWGKCFVASPAELAAAYPRFADFRRLRSRLDPERKFGNELVDGWLG
jgi:xylitol oxidase